MSKFLRAASLCCLASALFTPAIAQQTDPAADSALKIYRATVPRINDLVHTKLDVKFDLETPRISNRQPEIRCQRHGHCQSLPVERRWAYVSLAV
jgi:hypothetical protein